jgi:signal transduction histidine kinase
VYSGFIKAILLNQTGYFSWNWLLQRLKQSSHINVNEADLLLRQLFYNLIDNSLKHGEKATQIRLLYAKEGDELKLLYKDDGVGIPEANKKKLFDQGFTTGRGCGLGLHLIKKMIEVYGWTIEDGLRT